METAMTLLFTGSLILGTFDYIAHSSEDLSLEEKCLWACGLTLLILALMLPAMQAADPLFLL